MERKQFELMCRDGIEHKYGCLPHNSKTGGGLDLLLEIASIGGPILGGVIKAFLGFGDLSKLEDVSVDALSDSVTTIPERLISHGGSKFVGRVLQNTVRDGKDLSKPHEFDAAYTGNYGEMIKAVGKVLEINFSPFGEAGISSLSNLLQGVLASVEGLTGDSTANPESQKIID